MSSFNSFLITLNQIFTVFYRLLCTLCSVTSVICLSAWVRLFLVRFGISGSKFKQGSNKDF